MTPADAAAAASVPDPAAFPEAALEGSIPGRFLDIVRRHGDRDAVVHEGGVLSYRELDGLAGAVASRIGPAPAGETSCIALLFPQGPDLIIATLGALEAGHAYVPLAPRMRPEEWRERIGRTRVRALLVAPALAEAARAALGGSCAVHVVDRSLVPADPARPRPALAPATTACVYFTSGTTGPARGVVDTHGNVLHNVLRYSRALDFRPDDRMTVIQAATFSGVMSSTFGALLNGAALLPFDMSSEGAGPALARWIGRSRPTVFHSVPSVFRSLCTGDATFPSVRAVRLEGDVAAPQDVVLFRRHFPADAVLANGLGTTETGLVAQWIVRAGMPVPQRVLPVGFPVTHMSVAIADAEGREVPRGAPGEIHVISRWLAPGYWEDPARTAAVFSEIPGAAGSRRYRTGDAGRIDAEGRIEHLGRLDHQIKIQGEWIDLPAVERACESAPGVAAAAVTAGRDASGEVALAAYLVPRAGATPSWRSVTEHLLARLPALAVPGIYWIVAALPATQDGKLDRAALPRIEARRMDRDDAILAPRDPEEARLARIWGEVLSLPRIGVHDRWSDVGGTSLGAARVLSGIEKAFGASLTLSDFMEAHTIAELAAVIRRAEPGSARGALVRVQSGGRATPLFCVHDLESDAFLFAALARRLGPDQPVFALRFPAGEPAGRVPADMPALAARYVHELRAVQPHGPYRLAGFCFGAVVALEMAHRLEEEGEIVERLALLNVTPFDFPDLVSPGTRRRFRGAWLQRLRYLARKRGRWRWIRTRFTRVVRDRIARWNDRGDLAGRAPGGPADAECVRARLLHAFRMHHSRPFHGTVLVAPAAENLPLYADDPSVAWAGVSDPPPFMAVQPRDGYAMMVEPDVERLAVTFGPWLDRGSMRGKD